MKLFYIFLCLILSVNLSAQTYEPMLADSNEWYVMRTFEGSITNRIVTKNDTIIKGKLYKPLGFIWESPGNEIVFLRDDTANKKVYALPPRSKDTSEVIYCDYNLNVDDSIELYDVTYEGSYVGWFHVDSLRAFKTPIGVKKQFFLSGKDKFGTDQFPVWIETVGPLGHPGHPYATPDDWLQGILNCRYRNGVKIYQTEFSREFGDCDIRLGIDDLSEESPFRIYPNPFHNKLRIDANGIADYEITVLNAVGQVSRSLNNREELELSELDSGIYFIRIISRGKTYYHKIVKN